MARARTRNARGTGERLRDELLAAADEILDRTGDPAQVTVRGVAAAAGVAPNAVYLHFADRDALLAEVAIRRFDACTEAIREATATVTDARARMYAAHETYCRLALERPGHYRLLFRGWLHPADSATAGRLAEAGLRYFDTCLELCREAVDAGVLPPVDPMRLAGSIWALEHGWCELNLAGEMGSGLLPSAHDVLATFVERD